MKFPDIDGCYLQGTTIDEAVANAQEALQGHLKILLESGEKFIPPTHMNKINMEGTSFASYVSCDVDLVNIQKSEKDVNYSCTAE
ncbi:MAG: type II toxin-antitoxin system HicB family antitoxin [Eubacteriales bacterium]|nr:type II toxin-antitoxin system HicB family antitoxin [Eubacteriales bacterium]